LSDAPDHRLSDPHGQRQTFEHLVADEALIDATQHLHEALKHGLQPADNFREIIQQAPAVELADIVSHSLDAKHAFAF
jgi:predicted metal-dependent HD superfamily phosphohydrolase